jgi:hypothetical protein
VNGFRLRARARHGTELHDVTPSADDSAELDSAVLAVDRLTYHTISLAHRRRNSVRHDRASDAPAAAQQRDGLSAVRLRRW